MTDLNGDFEAVLARSARFWELVDRRGENECWHWKGGRAPSGSGLRYGYFYISKARKVRSHRAAYMIAKGQIPKGMLVCHTCDVPHCCNPAHLWLGTYDDNNKDRTEKGRTVRPDRDEDKVARPKGQDHWSAKLTAEQAIAIFQDPRSQKEIAAEYGIHFSVVSKIKLGKYWRSATEPLIKALLSQGEQNHE